MPTESVIKRETAAGRWTPIVLYAAILISWCLMGIAAGVGQRLWLVWMPLTVVPLYLNQTARRSR
jgi:hypothetical protein